MILLPQCAVCEHPYLDQKVVLELDCRVRLIVPIAERQDFGSETLIDIVQAISQKLRFTQKCGYCIEVIDTITIFERSNAMHIIRAFHNLAFIAPVFR